MSATHADRQAVYESLEPILGEQAALRLMDYLHFTPERELVSSTDMHANTLALKGEMAELRSDLRGEMAELRTDLTSEMSTRFDQQTRWMVGLISTNLAALIGAVIAIVLAFSM